MLGLLATRGSGDDGAPRRVDGALAKINRVLPSTLRRQVEALEETLGFTRTTGSAPADAAAVLLLADAIRRRRRLHIALPHVRRRRVGARAQPARPRRPLAAAGTSPRTTTCATTCARSASTGCGGPALVDAAALPPPDGLRPRRARDPIARERALEVGGRGAARPAGRRGGAAHPADARRARRRSRRHAAADARRLARLDGDRPRRARLRLHRSAGRTSCGRASAPSRRTSRRRSPSRGRRRSPGAACRRAAARRARARPAAARAPS